MVCITRDLFTVTQWNNVLRGLTLSKAREEITDTTLKVKVLRFNGRNYTEPNSLVYNDYIQQRYIFVEVYDKDSEIQPGDNAVILEVLYVGL